MMIKRICLVCLLMLTMQPVLAASAAVREMAGMLIKLEHHPDAAEKTRLMELAASKESTGQEQVVANAMANLNHTATDADKAKLKQVMDDTTAPTEVRELASIILGLNHMPSAEDKAKLKKMMK